MKNKGHKYRYRPNKTALLVLKFIFVISLKLFTFYWRMEYQKLPQFIDQCLHFPIAQNMKTLQEMKRRGHGSAFIFALLPMA